MQKNSLITSLDIKLPRKLFAFGLFICLTISVHALTTNEYLLSFFYLCFALVLSHALLSDYRHRRYLDIYEDGFELRNDLYKTWKKTFIFYDKISAIQISKDHGSFLEFKVEDKIVKLNLGLLSPQGNKYFLRTLEVKIPSVSRNACNKIKEKQRLETDFPPLVSTSIIVFMVITLMIYSAMASLHELQIEYDRMTWLCLVGALIVSFSFQRFLFKFFPLRESKHQKLARISCGLLVCSLTILGIDSTMIINQKFDKSKEALRIVDISRSHVETNSDNEKRYCYKIIDDNLKEADVVPTICGPEFSKAKANSRALIGIKQGFMGQRWIASVKVID